MLLFYQDESDESEMNNFEKIWNDFKAKTKTEMAIISSEEILNGKPSRILSFKSIIQIEVFKALEEIKKVKIYQPEFKEIV